MPKEYIFENLTKSFLTLATTTKLPVKKKTCLSFWCYWELALLFSFLRVVDIGS